MDLSFLKNPIILAILMTSLTYAYMYWDNSQKQKKNPKAELPPINMTTPVVVGLITLIVAYGLFGFSSKNDDVGKVLQQTNELPSIENQNMRLVEKKNFLNRSRLSERVTDSFDSNTYHLVGKNAIKLPSADVFIDIAKFN
ncbi:hypothetical protein QKU48_gp0435 [Fadolivirus algeromassiliense]|jgi:hypothetical protein|uniref:Uncharacterized protein n=1 Tax=Fadolivirus FV1/VV64 TaxID=3070911 RepID=A0A7D3UQL2_9VIRU|nr:hypothetical protein QKU48_gp0435 [Fadolivirus algeromassiliense]QKF93893.1 hypothetical protein Fadolivirus_1_435 [Fadolivirus FV1/VV64]